jgi:hypothetical protein
MFITSISRIAAGLAELVCAMVGRVRTELTKLAVHNG